MITFETVAYGGWATNYRLSNGLVDLIITGEVGPRIIRFGFIDRPNVFCEVPEHMGQISQDEWHLIGGHRLWYAPEDPVVTYYLDNQPPMVEPVEDFIRVYQPVESTTGIEKQMDVRLSPDQAEVTITHRLINNGIQTRRCAPWALSVMDAGGTAIIPLPPRDSHENNLLPLNTLSLWAYTRLNDPRWSWGERCILLRQTAGDPQKIGAYLPDGWSAYANHGQLFVKYFSGAPATYPDMGCNFETFTNDYMLELESLAPLVDLSAGDTIEHTETWRLHDGVNAPTTPENAYDTIFPLI